MSEKFRLDRKIGFRNTFYTKCINGIRDSIGPSIILRSISHSGYMSHVMRFPTMLNVRPAKAQTSLRIRAV